MGDRRLVLRFGQRNGDLAALYQKYAVSSASVLTAWNPYSELRPDAENQAAQVELISEIDRLGLRHEPGHGADPSEKWPTPFAGALVPLSSYRKDGRILSVMIEVNKRVYMDEHSGLKNQNFGQVYSAVGRLIVTAAEAAAEYSPTSAMPRAASTVTERPSSSTAATIASRINKGV